MSEHFVSYYISPTRTINDNHQKHCDDAYCDLCVRLHKHAGGTDQINLFDQQFETIGASWTNDMKDTAIRNNGSLGTQNNEALGAPFEGKLLPHKKPYGGPYRPMVDKCFKAGPPNNVRYLNAFKESTDNCEPYCGVDVCKEYGNALERYGECVERFPRHLHNKMCGKKPINPKYNGCAGCASTPVDYAMKSYERWLPGMECRMGWK
jgi:hypothetical protein